MRQPHPSRLPPPLKLDEDSASHLLENGLTQAGYDVDTVIDEGVGGASDDDVLLAATAAGRVLITQDKGIGDPRRRKPQPVAGVVRLQMPGQGPQSHLERLLVVLPQISSFADMLHIITLLNVRSAPMRGRPTSTS